MQGKGREQKGDFVVLTDSAARPIYAYLSMRRERDRGAPLFASLSNTTSELIIEAMTAAHRGAARGGDRLWA